MIRIGALLVLGILVAGVVWLVVSVKNRQSRAHHPTAMMRMPTPMWQPPQAAPAPAATIGEPAPPAAQVAAPSGTLQYSLQAWQQAGIISAEQATRIEAFEYAAAAALQPAPASAPVRTRRIPLVAEALGYLGATLGVVGLSLLIHRYWNDLATAGHLSVTILAALALTVAGLFVPEARDPAYSRLRSFVWTAASVAAAFAAGVIAVDAAHAQDGATIAVAVAATVALHSGLLWWGRAERPVQQIIGLAAGLVTVGTVVHQFGNSGAVGIAVWASAALLLTLSIAHLVVRPAVSGAIGAVGSLVGAWITTSRWHGPGLLFVLASVLTLLALAGSSRPLRTSAERIVLTVVAGVGLLQGTPVTVAWFGHAAGLVTGLVVWAFGAMLLLLANRPFVQSPVVAQILGGALLVGGAATTGMQYVAFATIFGLVTAIALIAVGMLPDHVLVSLLGCLGLVVNVPWAIRHFFPGEGRVPLMILVSGLLIVVVAVWLARRGGEIRHEFKHMAHHHNH
jgi:hypothetical protein